MINEIKQRLINGYEYVLIPNTATSTPLEMPVFAKETTGYYCLDELFVELGALLVPISVIGGNHILIRFGFKKNKEEIEFRKHIEGLGMTDMRATLNTYDKEVDEIDWNLILPSNYGLFSILEVKDIPRATNG